MTENLDSFERDELVYLARLGEQSERFEEVVAYVKAFIKKTSADLAVEERNILSVAYKTLVNQRRTSWRVLQSIEAKEHRQGSAEHQAEAEKYRAEIEQELKRYCDEVLALIGDELLPKASGAEARVFYLKMQGDYCRYMAEFAQGGTRHHAASSAEKHYQDAFDLARNELPPTHPTRLGLALNFSVFYFEARQDHARACQIAKSAFDEALPELENVTEESYRDSTHILQLLRDNLTMWNSGS